MAVNITFTYDAWDSMLVINDLVTQLNVINNTQDSSITALNTNAIQIYPGKFAGLKDASGVNGNFFLDSSAYIKLNGAWHSFKVTDLSLG